MPAEQELWKFYRPPGYPGYKSRVFIPVGRRVGRRQRGRLLRGWRRGIGKGRERGGSGREGIKMFTLKLQRPQNSCMQRNQDCWLSAVTECTCCYTQAHVRAYIYIHTYFSDTYTHIHTCTRTPRRMVRSRTHASRQAERNTSRPHFQFVSVYLKNGECNSRSARSSRFSRHAAESVHKKRENHCATRGVTFSPFHTFCFRILARCRINEPRYQRCSSLKNMILINPITLSYRHKGDVYFYT